MGNECPGSRQTNFAGAVMPLDIAPEQSGIAGATQPVSKPVSNGVNSTEGLPREKVWKSREKGLNFADSAVNTGGTSPAKRTAQSLTFSAGRLLFCGPVDSMRRPIMRKGCGLRISSLLPGLLPANVQA